MNEVKWFTTEKCEYPDIDPCMEYVDVWVYFEGVVQHAQYENPSMNEYYFQLDHGECVTDLQWAEYKTPESPKENK